MRWLAALLRFCFGLCSAQLPFMPNVGNYSFPITTKSADAQALFNTGMMLEFNFNQAYAQAFFNASMNSDPKAPMPAWGLAWSLGPFINMPMINNPPRMQQAYNISNYAAALAAASIEPLKSKEIGYTP